MKKIISLVIAVIAFAGASKVSAQMRWGVTAGADITDLKWSQETLRLDKFDSKNSLGYFAGIIGEYEIPGIGFGVDLGLQYVQRGATMNLGDFKVWQSDGYGDERSYLHYLDIPIHLRFKYMHLNGFERKLAPFVFAGPDIGILLAHNLPDSFEYKSVQLGLEVGLGVEIFRNFQLSGSYTWDVTGTMKAKKLDNFTANNRTWKIALAYFF